MFYGRKKEIEKINQILSLKKFQSILLIGRWRIGKTALLGQVFNSYKHTKIYFQCDQSKEAKILQMLAEEISKTFGLNYIISSTNIYSIFDFIFEKSLEEEILFVIDEYSYLRDAIDALDSILQKYIDRYYEKSKMKLIISGSYVKTLNEIKEHSHPLFGRFDEIINLKDLNYLEASNFYPNYSLEEKVKAYSVFGGCPYYNKWIDDSISVEQNIINKVLTSEYYLDMPLKMYTEEIKTISNAVTVFYSISNGKHKFSDLATSNEISSSNLSSVVASLLEIGLINKYTPINEPKNHKKTFYHIEDNYLDFYFRYISDKQSRLAFRDKKIFYEKEIKEDLQTFFIPKKFEKIVYQSLIQMNLNQTNNINFKNIGRYWYDDSETKTNLEFDVVLQDDNDIYTFVEVKYTNKPIDETIVNEEISQLEKLSLENYKLGFVSKSGFNLKDKKDYLLLTLKDLYSL